mmetsp:Transcript_27972/g.71487  ORF Transcript_27972/g.71487 Transcript_27972/m.71487 type:complete len:434 (+) Transcript_27972:69-1370(+)
MLHVTFAATCLSLSSGLSPAPRLSVARFAAAPSRAAPVVLNVPVDDETCTEEECFIFDDEEAELKKPEALVSYSENSRQFRRTVYSHEAWVQHRGTERFFKNFASTLDSGVVRSLYTEIIFVTTVAAAVVALNMGIAGYEDLSNVHHEAPFPLPTIKSLSLPALPFTIAMPALSLLLVFRTNTAYSRWNEARTLWGGIVNTCRNLQRQSNAYFAEDPQSQVLRVQLANQVALFPKALRSFLRGVDDDPTFKKDAIELVGLETAEALMVSKNRPTFMCNMISATVRRANIDPMDRARMDECTSKLVDYLGACERIFKSPIPLVYTRHTARFLTTFMVLLPFALWGPMGESWNHWATIPATAALAIFLFGIEELGIQIEEPFGILPLEALCDGSIEAVVVDMRDSYTKGHFGPLDKPFLASEVKSEQGVVMPTSK